MYKVGLYHPGPNSQGCVFFFFSCLTSLKQRLKKKINFYGAKADQFHFLLHVMHHGML